MDPCCVSVWSDFGAWSIRYCWIITSTRWGFGLLATYCWLLCWQKHTVNKYISLTGAVGVEVSKTSTFKFAKCLAMKDEGVITLTLPGPTAGVSGSLDSYCSLKPLCSGMGEVVPVRTLLTLLPPSPRTVLLLSSFKVLQCINCRD